MNELVRHITIQSVHTRDFIAKELHRSDNGEDDQQLHHQDSIELICDGVVTLLEFDGEDLLDVTRD